MLPFSPATAAALDHAREMLLGRGLTVLAAWALLNLVVSGYLVRQADRRQEAQRKSERGIRVSIYASRQ